MSGPEDFDAERRRIVRKVGILAWGVAGLAVALAVVGGALAAWIMSVAGYPFLRTWLILSLLLLGIPIAVHLAPWSIGRGGRGERSRRRPEPRAGEAGEAGEDGAGNLSGEVEENDVG